MFRNTLACAVFAALWLTLAATSRGAITTEGQVQLTIGTSVVGTSQGDGTVHVTPPSTLTASSLQIAQGFTSPIINGSVFVEGGAVVVSSDTNVGAGGHGLLQITDGGTMDSPRLYVGGLSSTPTTAEGKVIIGGGGSKLRTREETTVGYYTLGELTISGGGALQPITPQSTSGIAYLGRQLGSIGKATVDGTGSTWTQQGELIVGNSGSGTLNILHGAVVTSSTGSIGKLSGGLGQVIISGPGSRWSSDKFTVGDGGVGDLRVEDGGTLDVGGVESQGFALGAQQGSFGRLTISGASSRWNGGATVGDRGAGELYIEDGAIVTAGASLGRSGGSGLAVVRGQGTRWQPTSLTLGQTTGSAELCIEDGAVVSMPSGPSVATVGGVARVVLNHGTLTAGTLSQLTLDNRGTIEGNGDVAIQTFRNSSGRVLLGAGDHLKFTGSFTNQVSGSLDGGRVEALGGEFEVVGAFNNNANCRVIAEGATLRFRGNDGAQNSGQVNVTGGVNRVFGRVTNNSTGVVAVTGGAKATFYDNVKNNGLMSAAGGTNVTVLGSFSGNGIGGAGAVELDGPVAPGFSPGVMDFGGDVTLGATSRLDIEVMGTSPGQFDQLAADGKVSLGGALQLSALAVLGANATLPIVEAGELAGTFSSVPAIGTNIGNGVRFNGITYDYNHDEVRVSLVQSEPADFNLDGVVSGEDLLVWQQSLGAPTDPGCGADANCDGVVDAADLGVWNAAMAAASANQSASGATVPEPRSKGLLLVGVVSGLAVSRVRLGSRRARCRF